MQITKGIFVVGYMKFILNMNLTSTQLSNFGAEMQACMRPGTLDHNAS